MQSWSPSDQETCVDICITAWTEHKWGLDELVKVETELQGLFSGANALDSTIEQRLDTLFGAFDEKVPSRGSKQQILGNLDRAGGKLLDVT